MVTLTKFEAWIVSLTIGLCCLGLGIALGEMSGSNRAIEDVREAYRALDRARLAYEDIRKYCFLPWGGEKPAQPPRSAP